jgi:hypothetical protein
MTMIVMTIGTRMETTTGRGTEAMVSAPDKATAMAPAVATALLAMADHDNDDDDDDDDD